MPQPKVYRLYRFGRDGLIAERLLIQAANDAEATELARDYANGLATEVWLVGRMIARIEVPQRKLR